MKPLLVVAGAFGVLFLAACDAPKQASRQAPPRPVLVAQIHYVPREREQVLPGVVKARIESDLAFRVAGKMAQRLVDAGAQVRRGDPLARLDETDFQPAARTGRGRTELRPGGARTGRSRGTAHHDADAPGLGGERRFRQDPRRRRSGARRRDEGRTRGHAGAQRARLHDAEGRRRRRRQPGLRPNPARSSAAGAPIVRLAHTDEREAAVAIPENLVDRVRANPARVEFWALPGVSVGARLRELSPNADAATRTYPARFSLLDAPESVRLGMSLTVVSTADGVQVARVPAGAIFDAGQGPNVWTVDPATGDLERDAGDRRRLRRRFGLRHRRRRRRRRRSSRSACTSSTRTKRCASSTASRGCDGPSSTFRIGRSAIPS